MRKLHEIKGRRAALLALCLVLALTMGLTACGQKAEEETDGGETLPFEAEDPSTKSIPEPRITLPFIHFDFSLVSPGQTLSELQ